MPALIPGFACCLLLLRAERRAVVELQVFDWDMVSADDFLGQVGRMEGWLCVWWWGWSVSVCGFCLGQVGRTEGWFCGCIAGVVGLTGRFCEWVGGARVGLGGWPPCVHPLDSSLAFPGPPACISSAHAPRLTRTPSPPPLSSRPPPPLQAELDFSAAEQEGCIAPRWLPLHQLGKHGKKSTQGEVQVAAWFEDAGEHGDAGVCLSGRVAMGGWVGR